MRTDDSADVTVDATDVTAETVIRAAIVRMIVFFILFTNIMLFY